MLPGIKDIIKTEEKTMIELGHESSASEATSSGGISAVEFLE